MRILGLLLFLGACAPAAIPEDFDPTFAYFAAE